MLWEVTNSALCVCGRTLFSIFLQDCTEAFEYATKNPNLEEFGNLDAWQTCFSQSIKEM